MMDSDSTYTSSPDDMLAHDRPLLVLTLLWHPEPARIGLQTMGPASGGTMELSRYQPAFAAAFTAGEPLGCQAISRTPILIRRNDDDTLHIRFPVSRMAVEVNNMVVSGEIDISSAQVEDGVVLGLGGQVLICLHWMRRLPQSNPLPGLLGVGCAAITLRDQIRQAAATRLAVLLLGETGTGKDVAARAIHAGGPLAGQPMVAVNMAALNESLAAADLFGAVKGAYTGAQVARQGLFAEASGGTIFLDEIGDTPALVQPMLLRVLETGEFRPLGARENMRSSARLIAATDQDLYGGNFNQALLRRMEAFAIRVPALRERREDIGLLLRHFLEEQGNEGDGELPPKLPFSFVSAACNYAWPGNIRQLAHVTRRAVMAVRAGNMPILAAITDPAPARMSPPGLRAAPVQPSSASPQERTVSAARNVPLSRLSSDEVALAMESSAWEISSAARQLGISRPSLYKLLEAHPSIRRPESIPAEEIRTVMIEVAGDLEMCAARLKTPREALRRHLRALGLDAA